MDIIRSIILKKGYRFKITINEHLETEEKRSGKISESFLFFILSNWILKFF